MAMMASGLFEQSHALMGFEDVFIAMLEEPEAMHQLLDRIMEFKLTWCRMLVENCKPDAVLFTMTGDPKKASLSAEIHGLSFSRRDTGKFMVI